jgi:WD40 repeat protein
VLTLRGHHGKVHTLAFSPDGLTLASVAGHGREIWLWDLLRGTVKAKALHDRRVVSLAFAPDENYALVCADSQGGIGRLSSTQVKVNLAAAVTPCPNHPVRIAFTPQGDALAATGKERQNNGPIQLHTKWKGVTTWEWPSFTVLSYTPAGLYSKGVSCLGFAPNGHSLLIGLVDGWIYLFEETKQSVEVFRLQHGQSIHYVAYAPDGSTFASAGQRGLIKVWDARTWRKRITLKGQGKYLHGIAYSPDSATLATASGDGKVRFWDVASGRLRYAFDWGVGQVHSIAFAPDGMRAAAGGDNDIMIWDIDEW